MLRASTNETQEFSLALAFGASVAPPRMTLNKVN